MKRAFIFGAGGFGREILQQTKDTYHILGFLDNDSKRWGEIVDGIEILGSTDVLNRYEYDEIILGTMAMAIVEQLVSVGIPKTMINTSFISVRIDARKNFVSDYAHLLGITSCNCDYCVAEGGVFQGEFAREISLAFPTKDIYLFDTFEGFDERDTLYDQKNGFSDIKKGHFDITSVAQVIDNMPYVDKVHICKGFFPESTKEVSDDIKYGFVNLDFDLFQPTLEGLRYFYPKMIEGGIILIHDFYHLNYKAVPEAIKQFESENNMKLIKFPIGDHCSMAIMKI